MKNSMYIWMLGVSMSLFSCSDIMDEKHDNPDAFTETKIEYLFA